MPRPTLFNNPKFRVACRRLNIPEAYLLGHLEFLWASANECGNPEFSCHEAVEAAARWVGEDGALTAVISKSGSNFIDQTDSGSYAIHDYWDHAPDYVRKRKGREDERKSNSRTKQHSDRSVADNGGIRRNSAENGTPPTPTPTPSHAPTPTQKESFPGPADAGHGETVPVEDNSDLPDPLEKLPLLSKAYNAIQGRIKQVHPQAKIPEPGTKADIGARTALECLVRLDKHSEQEILDTLRWVLYTEPEGDFTWRAQFHSIANLRHVKGGMSKFAKMLEAMKRFNKQAARAKIDPDEPLHHREAREKGILP